MEPENKYKWYVAGIALVIAVGVFILFIFSLISRTDKTDRYLVDTGDERFGWDYELLVNDAAQAYEPEFADSGYPVLLPEGTSAVRITRTMTEDILGAELQWMSYLDGVEVWLDGELLHSDFPEAARGADGFLRPTEEEWDRLLDAQSNGRKQIRMSLPAGYQGKRLSVTTYFPEDRGIAPAPEYPYLGSEDSYRAQYVVAASIEYMAVVLYAFLTVLSACIFLLDIHNNDVDGKTLLLTLYFALMFLNCIYDSPVGYYSELGSRMDLSFLYGIYIAPLYLYLVLRLTKWWKYPLCAGIVLWVAYECVRRFLNVRRGLIMTYGYTGKGMFILILALAAAFAAEMIVRGRQGGRNRKALLFYGLTAAAVTAVYLVNRIRIAGGIHIYLIDQMFASFRFGYYEVFVGAVTDIVSYMTLIAVAAEVIRRTVQTRRTMDILRERERQSLENYHHLLAAQEATSALRHEMRHHFNALAGILESGDVKRASDYAAAVAGEYEQLPTGYYSRNMLVNIIAGTYLDQARKIGIRTDYRLDVPAELDIADEDLSVFLSNMLQNALEACQRMEAGAERYIRAELHLKGNFLFVKCVNSAPEKYSGADDEKRTGHGYGLTAMRKVAKKYNSVLLIHSTDTEFEVKSCFCLTKNLKQEG